MSEYVIQGETLTGIADAIRAQLGTEQQYTPESMAAAIGSIKGVDAPEESILKISAVGTGLASVSPSAAGKMQGLTLYGRSWQDGTPSVEQEVPIQSAGQSGFVDVQITDGGSKSQQFIVPTPDGLPGIPVDSGGNWTDENGQQWVSDVVDLAAGTKAQNIWRKIITESDNLYRQENYDGDGYYGFFMLLNAPVLALDDNNPGISSKFVPAKKGVPDGLNQFRIWAENNTLYVTLATSDVEEAKESMIGTEFLIKLSEPITTPLDAETIDAYKALKSYSGTTNVLAQDAGIEATAYGNAAEYVEQHDSLAKTVESMQNTEAEYLGYLKQLGVDVDGTEP